MLFMITYDVNRLLITNCVSRRHNLKWYFTIKSRPLYSLVALAAQQVVFIETLQSILFIYTPTHKLQRFKIQIELEEKLKGFAAWIADASPIKFAAI